MPQYSNFNDQFAAKGGIYITDTSAHAGPFCMIYAHTACVIASVTCAAWVGTLTSITIPAGASFPFPNPGATALTLTSGTATLVNN